MNKIKIELGKNSYEILLGKQLLDNAGILVKNVVKGSKVFIVTDSVVGKIYGSRLENSLKNSGFEVAIITIPNGEKSKNFSQLEKIIDEIFKNQPERRSTLIALGGGVVGDITGFAASIILRGVNFIQIPTSLLAMVDSSVGGKTGINLKYGKNLAGSFYQPKLVIADIDVLETLPERELLAGYAEIVKYGLINNEQFFEFLEKENDFSKIEEMIRISCESKAEIVAKDEKENDIRALLNLGHTFGHALEAIFEYDGRLLHGEAVAIGMVLAFKFSEFLGVCNAGCAYRIEKLLRTHSIRTKISELGSGITVDKIVDFMYQDKKVSGGNLVFILASDIGKSFIKSDVTEKNLREFLKKEI